MARHVLLLMLMTSAVISISFAWAPLGSMRRATGVNYVTLSMKADSYDTAMLENPDDHITVVDGVPTIQYSPAETLAICESRYFIRKYMGSVLRAIVSILNLAKHKAKVACEEVDRLSTNTILPH